MTGMPESLVMPVITGNLILRLGWAAQPWTLGTAPRAGLEPEPRVSSLPQAAPLSGRDQEPPPILPGVPEGAQRRSCP